MLGTIKNSIKKYPLRWLMIYALVIRCLVILFYDGYTIVNDSQDYIDLGKRLSEFNLKGYSGERTPGFPLFLLFANNNLQWVVYFQMVLGLLNTYLIFDVTKITTNNKLLAFITALISTSFLHLVFYEAAIMTETTTLTFLLIIFWFTIKFDVLQANSTIIKLIILSVLCAYLYLIRPMFIYLPILMALFYIFKNFKFNYKKALIKPFLILFFPMIIFYSWCKTNEYNIGYFGSTYYLGYNLSQLATPFFEKVPTEDAVIRDIFVKHRDSIIKHNPGQLSMSVWYAHEELLDKTKLTPHALSLELGRISKDLFKEYPNLYFKQVFISWKDFWTEKLMWNYEKINNKIVRKGIIGLWIIVQQYIGLIINLLFLLFSIKKMMKFIKSKFRQFDIELLIVLTVLAGSFAQALVVYGSNGRFSFPYFVLIVYFVSVNLYSSIRSYVRNT